MKITDNVQSLVIDRSVSISSLVKKMGYRYTATQVSNACSYLTREGVFVRTGHGIYARKDKVKQSTGGDNRSVKADNQAFLDRFYKVEGCDNSTEFLNVIVDKYKNELLKGL